MKENLYYSSSQVLEYETEFSWDHMLDANVYTEEFEQSVKLETISHLNEVDQKIVPLIKNKFKEAKELVESFMSTDDGAYYFNEIKQRALALHAACLPAEHGGMIETGFVSTQSVMDVFRQHEHCKTCKEDLVNGKCLNCKSKAA